MEDRLKLSEKLFLLAIHPVKGGIIFSAQTPINHVLVGAFIFELINEQKISINNRKVNLISSYSNDIVHNQMLARLKKYDYPKRLSWTYVKLRFIISRLKRLLKRELAYKNLIRFEQKHLLFFSWTKPYISNSGYVRGILDKIEKNISSGKLNEEDKMLLLMMEPAGLLKRIFPDRAKRKQVKERLKLLSVNEPFSDIIRETIKSIRAARSATAAGA